MLVAIEPPLAREGVDELPSLGRLVVVGEEFRPLLLQGDQLGRLLDLEEIGREMLDARVEDSVDARAKRHARLAGNADHQVRRDVAEDGNGERNRLTSRRGVVAPLEIGKLVVSEGLNADREAVHPEALEGGSVRMG